MYAREINNTIVRVHPSQVPQSIYDGLLDDHIELDTDEKRAQYGYHLIEIPTYNSRTHTRTTNVIEDNGTYTYEVVSLNKTLDDLKAELLKELKGYWKEAFAEGKPYMDYLTATSQSAPTDVQTKINALYGLLGTIKGQIAALTTVEEALAYEMPMTDINEGLEYLRKLL